MTIDSGFNHITVLLDEAVEALAVRADGCYLDGTFGRGGHTRGILAALGPNGKLHAFDMDPEVSARIDRTHFPFCSRAGARYDEKKTEA